ncbi:hypothetical protein FRC09_019687 [Ceratobasidium sp. 395]|nr:hypothetical protein FRC09_019687 [Ceratobasidium sp. 395]
MDKYREGLATDRRLLVTVPRPSSSSILSFSLSSEQVSPSLVRWSRFSVMRPFIFFFSVYAIFFAVVVGAREDRVARLKRQLLNKRQEGAFKGPTTVTTTRTAETFAGTVIETCLITLTPITGKNGENLVREERKCSTQLVKSSTTLAATTTTAQSTSTIQASTTSVSTVVVTETVSGSVAPSTTATSVASTSTASASTTSSVSTSTDAKASSVSSTSTSSTSAARTTLVVSSTSSAATSTAEASSTSSAASSAVTSATSSSSTSAAASSSAPPTSSAVTGGPAKEIVRKKLEVLPIGLGVFAGISVIALIVVGLVTYERTKYRKAFRQRKLAEQGAGMGYSGMSERV